MTVKRGESAVPTLETEALDAYEGIRAVIGISGGESWADIAPLARLLALKCDLLARTSDVASDFALAD